MNKAAFAQPAPGTFGDLPINAIKGPGGGPSTSRSRETSRVRRRQNVELRLESFNLLNHFNWGNPATNLNLGTFGRITTMQGTPRILQFGLKYGF